MALPEAILGVGVGDGVVGKIRTRTTGSGCQSISSADPRPTPTSSLQLSRTSEACTMPEENQSRRVRFARLTVLHSVQKRVWRVSSADDEGDRGADG